MFPFPFYCGKDSSFVFHSKNATDWSQRRHMRCSLSLSLSLSLCKADNAHTRTHARDTKSFTHKPNGARKT